MKTIIIAILLFVPLAQAVQMRPDACVVDRLAEDAQFAFCGVCTGVEKVVPPNSETLGAGATSYTFKVNDDIIGNIGKDTITFKQSGTPYVTRWLVHFEQGREYCVLLSCNETSLFCAPTGLTCGRFDVKKDNDGKRRVNGALRTRAIFRGIEERRPSLSKDLSTNERDVISRDEPLEYSDFVSIVKKLRKR